MRNECPESNYCFPQNTEFVSVDIRKSFLNLDPIAETNELINDYFGFNRFNEKTKLGNPIKNVGKFLEIKKRRLETNSIETPAAKNKLVQKQDKDNLSSQLKMLDVFSKKILSYN